MSVESETKRVQLAIDAAIANKRLLSYNDAKSYLRLARIDLKSKEDYHIWFKSNELYVSQFLPDNPEEYYSNHK
jgi:hypothetical protein